MDLSLPSLFEQYITAWNQHDADALVSMLSETCVYTDVSANEKITGSALTKFMHDTFVTSQSFVMKVEGEPTFSQNSIAFQFIITGYINEMGDFKIQGAEFLKIDNQKITQINSFDNWDAFYSDRQPTSPLSSVVSRTKYQRTGLHEQQAKQYAQQLRNAMESEKLYRQSDLTLNKLAVHLHIPAHHLSQVINNELGVNFTTLINGYRLTEAQQCLRELPTQRGLVLSIALSVGFNSPAAFYAIFKKQIGITPSDYREQYFPRASE